MRIVAGESGRGEIDRVERQLEWAQQITHIGSWEWDLATNTVTWSDELYRIYGLEPRSVSITYETFLSRVHPDDRAHTVAQVKRALERGGRFAYPERIVRPDGSIRELDTVGEVVTDADGRAVALMGTCRDVTDEKKREEALTLFEDIFHNVQIGLTVWLVEDPDDIARVRLVSFNPAAESVARQPLTRALGSSLREIVPYAAGGQLERLITAVAKDGVVREAQVARSRDPIAPTRSVSMKAFPLPSKCVGVAFEDITESMRARRLQEGEARLLEMIATDAPLPWILTALAHLIEEEAPPALASILLLDPDGVRIRHGAAPSLPDEYNRAIEGQPIGPNAGSCGAAAYTRKPVYVTDIETDLRWCDYRELARQHSLRACASTPICTIDGRVLGTFALYYKEPHAPSNLDEELIGRATRLAAIAILRREMIDELRALSEHLEKVREEERTGIAREIHDELGQALTALKMDLAWVARRAASGEALATDKVREHLKAMSTMTDEIIQTVRRISAELRPGVLDDLGLLAAIEWQAQEFERRTGTSCTIDSSLAERRFDRRVSTAVFRIFQEALTNVTRHAHASHVDVHLAAKDEQLELVVADDGVGIPREAVKSPRSLGLLGIRERARSLGGAATIEPRDGGGTVLTLRVPLAPEAAR